MTPRFGRVVLLDPGLGPIPGHWASLAASLKTAFEGFGLEVLLCGHKRQEPSILESLEVMPLFTLTPYEPFGADPHNREAAHAAFLAQKTRFADDFEALDPGPRDLLVLTAVYPQILGGLAEWKSRREERARQSAAVLFQFSEEVNVYNKTRGAGGDHYYVDYYRELIPAHRGPDQHRAWRYFAASPGLADLFSVLLGQPVKALPMPGSRIRAAAPVPAGGPLTIAILGHAAIEKGSLLLPDIIHPTLAEFADVRFNFHLSTNPDTRQLDRQFAADSERLAIVRGYVSDAKMQAMVDQADIVLLPYRPLKYRIMPSAIFVAAASAGKVVVLPANSHMHREIALRGGGAVVFREHSAAGIRDALWQAIRSYPALKPKAAAAARAHREFNNPRNYAKLILDAFAEDVAGRSEAPPPAATIASR